MRTLVALFAAVALAVALTGAARAHQPEGGLYPAYQFPEGLAPAIDGDISDWDVVPEPFWLTLEKHFEETVRGAGTDDLTDLNVRCIVGWSAETNRLYVMAHVVDDYLHNARGENGYPTHEFNYDDDINVVVDADHSGGLLFDGLWSDLPWEEQEELYYTTGQLYTMLVPPIDGYYSFMYFLNRGTNWWLTDGTGDLAPEYLRTGWTRTGETGGPGTYTYEYMVTPWEFLSVDGPQASTTVDLEQGNIIHIGFLFKDYDASPNYEGSYDFPPHHDVWRNADLCADFVLMPVTDGGSAPAVALVSPDSGWEFGGLPVTIMGTNFQDGAIVTFGGAQASDVVVVDSNTITATTPAHAAGAVDVVVRNPDGEEGRLESRFTFSAPPVITEEQVWAQLEQLTDDMFGTPLSVVDMGLVYDIDVDGDNNVYVVSTVYHRGFVETMRLASPVRQKILQMEGVGDVTVECVREPAWTPGRLSQKARDALGFRADDPVEGALHVRASAKADLDAPPLDQRPLARDHLAITAASWGRTDTLAADRLLDWRSEWRFFKRFEVAERDGLTRRREPIHIEVAFAGDQIDDPAREIRLVEEGSEAEIPCQVYGHETVGGTESCSIVFLAEVDPHQGKGYLILYGNPSEDLSAPSYASDLVTTGRDHALEIENSYYKVYLSSVMGQLKSLVFKRWGNTALVWPDPPTETITDATNDPGTQPLDIAWHGEDTSIHWNPDFRDQLRFRITLWPEPPNYTVVKGPLCTIVKRWGYPISPIYPALPQTAVTIEVTYFFYAGLPYIIMQSRLDVAEEVDMSVVRNDEWVFPHVFTHAISMMEGERVRTSSTGFRDNRNPALVGLFDEEDGDAFASLRLSFDSRGFPNAYDPTYDSITTHYPSSRRADILQLWVRWSFVSDGQIPITIRPGATMGEENAYLVYNIGEEGGQDQAKDWYDLLRRPLKLSRDISTVVSQEEGSPANVPETFVLSQNWPNPFNATTAIRYGLPVGARVDLVVFDIAGQKVATLLEGTRRSGYHTVHWDGRDDGGRQLASGVYLCRLRAGEQAVETRRLLLIW